MKNFNQQIGLILKGAAMGIAEVIPGVSGGTIAFITGIYEKLINTIKAFSPSLIGDFKRDGIGGVWSAINGNFLLFLGAGMVGGLVAGVFGVTHLLENYPQHLWGFFFGLIIASAIYIGRQVPKWGVREIVGVVLGTALAFYITIASPATGNEALWFVMLSGMIAISALILPGISGSFILLLMGMYQIVLPSVRSVLENQDMASLKIMGAFAIGCIIGLAIFSRVLSWMFKNYQSLTLAVLTGFLVGSLNKIYPWRNVLEYRTNSRDEQVPFLEESVLPSAFEGEPHLVSVLVLMVIGFVVVFAIDRMAGKN